MEDERLPGAQPPEGGDSAPPDDSRWEEGDSLNFLSAPPAGRPAGEDSRPVPTARQEPLKKSPAGGTAHPQPGAETAGEEPPGPLKTNRVIRLAQVRRRRNARRLRILVGLTLALTLALAWALGALAHSLGALSDLADTVRIGLTPGEGFPVKTNISPILQLEELSGGFVELGEQDLVLYSASGARLRSIQHNYSRPALTAGRTRFCVYARSGNELRVESRSQTLYTKVTDSPLLLCAMSQDGGLAVVTRSARYAAQVSIYSPRMEYLYGWSPSDKEGTPCLAAFSDNGKKLATACLKAQDGQLVSGIYFLDTEKSSQPVSSAEVTSMPLQMAWLDSVQLLVIYQDRATVYNALTGEEKYSYDFGGESLLSASISGKNAALLFSGGTGTFQDHLVVLDDRMEPRADLSTEGEADQVVCTRTAAYILEESAVRAYTLGGEEKWTVETEEKPLALLDAKKLLLFTGQEAYILQPSSSSG